MTQQRNNYFKLVALIVDVAYLVISKYIKEKILGSDSFESFLNKEKHKLVHIYETSPCCECRILSINGEKLISKKQLHILYKSDEGTQIRDHKEYTGNKLTRICICKYSAKAHIDVRVADITLANYIIQKCGKQELGINNWIKQIKDVRNEIFHLSDIQEMTDDIFGRKWSKLEGSIMGIAKVIGSAYPVETERMIMQTKNLTIVDDYMLKYEIICRDYWINKCAEFERAQHKMIEEKAASLHHTMPQCFSRSMEEDCQKTMRRIDVKRIHIPVVMQLDIPTSWDKTKVFEAIDGFRLNGTTDMNIRIKAISIEDITMYAEVAERVLCNIHKLRSEINKLMSTMLSEAEINTTEHAEFGVNLKIPDRSDVFFSLHNTTHFYNYTITRLVPRPGYNIDSSRIKSIRAGKRAAVKKFFKKLDELNTDSEMDIDIAGPIIDAIVKKQSVILKLDEQILENTSDAS
ncbi:Hypothetical predicted protein [Mytilus galloprovincialis]|uniref:DZIP3-like HEPN domain-containing protein n=1 Tax=Mytilus galloprovincialis TaxID=29158 RepID=A0A8B6BJI6_MYTGA|nr:Hypothetical predicted protein [Mytilus galloprovincialis]